MSLSPELQVLVNTGAIGVICYLLITRIEKKLDDLISSINKLVSAVNISGTHA
jgi:hypothetical protein